MTHQPGAHEDRDRSRPCARAYTTIPNVLKVRDIRNKNEVFGLNHLNAANAPTLSKRDRHRNAVFFPLPC